MNEIRTDLALESRNFYLKQNNLKELDGITANIEKTDIYTKTEVSIKTKEASEKIGKPSGNYITIQSEFIESGLFTEELSAVFSSELIKLIPCRKKNPLIFAAGLGNLAVTPDALGPKVVSSLIVSRHLPEKSKNDLSLSHLSALAPGVLGITGIETAEIIHSIAEKIKPDCIIAIDALASASASHVGCTIQLSDTGINPGSGVNNRRTALNEDTLGVPVISVGVPTVSDISSILKGAFEEIINVSGISLSDEEKRTALNRFLVMHSENAMVTPKNIDAVISRAALILSRGINLAVHRNLDYHTLSDYTS